MRSRASQVRATLLVLTALLVPNARPQQSDMPTFGTTVVIPFGLHGLIYFVHPRIPALPAFSAMDSVGVIYTPVLNVPARVFKEGFPGVTNRIAGFAIDYTGRFYVDTPGNYQFRLTSDDGSKLYIDGRLVIDHDGIHPPRARTGAIDLTGGIHRIRVSYYQGPPLWLALVLEVAGPDGNWQIFSTDHFKPPADPDQWKYGKPGDLGPDDPPLADSQVPKKAQKSFADGAAELADGDLKHAREHLEHATKQYKDYAQAWNSLGQLSEMEQDTEGARHAYERALAANPDYIPAYVRLANLNLTQGRYTDVLQITGAALAHQPTGDPLIYLYDAVAKEHLKRLDDAEKSARLAIDGDMAREAPLAEYLLGMLLAAKHDIPGALEHLRTYLKISPHARDTEEVRGRIKELEQQPPAK